MLYQDRFRTPEYFLFSPETLEFEGYRLANGRYEPILANEAGHLWSETLGLYLGLQVEQLRYFSDRGELILTPEEAAERAEARAARLAEQLKALGIEPEE